MDRTTTIQNPEAIRKGSARVLVGEDFSSLVDIGAVRDLSFAFMNENQRIEFDNAPGLDYFVRGKRIQATFNLTEIDFDNIAALDDGMLVKTEEAGEAKTGEEQLVNIGNWNYDQFIMIMNQNGDRSEINVNSVTGSQDGELTQGTDFNVARDTNGNYGIIVVNSGNVSTMGQTLTINYDYTPNAAKKIRSNSHGRKNLKVMRLIQTNERGQNFIVDIIDGTNKTPISLDLAGDEEEDVAVQPIDFQGYLAEYTDEQAV